MAVADEKKLYTRVSGLAYDPSHYDEMFSKYASEFIKKDKFAKGVYSTLHMALTELMPEEEKDWEGKKEFLIFLALVFCLPVIGFLFHILNRPMKISENVKKEEGPFRLELIPKIKGRGIWPQSEDLFQERSSSSKWFRRFWIIGVLLFYFFLISRLQNRSFVEKLLIGILCVCGLFFGSSDDSSGGSSGSSSSGGGSSGGGGASRDF